MINFMNILVVASQILGDTIDLECPDFIDDIHDIYFNGHFDRLIIIHSSNIDVDVLFPFARCFVKTINNWNDFAATMISFLTELTNTLSPDCMFTILCSSENYAQELILSTTKHIPICFMETNNNVTDITNFIQFPKDDLSSTPNCHYFRSFMAQYKHSHDGMPTLTSEINKFYRVNIHCVRKPSTNTISD